MESRQGIVYGVGAYVIWGLSPLFWNLIEGVRAIDLLTHRIVWSVPILALVFAVTRRWSDVASGYRTRRAKLVTLAAAAMLATNWALFIWAVTHDHIVEASLGYFINPLVSVALGVIVLGERLRPVQWAAVGVAAGGVVLMTVLVGSVPWISLVLACSFGTYGLLKKDPSTPRPLVSLFGEVSIIAVPAVVAMVVAGSGNGPHFGSSPGVTLFLVSAGLITVAPLVLFGAAVARIELSTIGLLQYLTPTMHFLLGVFAYGETMTPGRLAGFIVVWAALALYTADLVRSPRRSRAVA